MANGKSEQADYLPLIAQHNLFRGMSREEIESVLARLDGRVLSFQAGDHLEDHLETRPGRVLGCILSGWGQVYKVDPWGNQSIMDFMSPDYLLGFHSVFTSARPTKFRAVATQPGYVLMLDAAELLDPTIHTDFPLLAKLEKNLVSVLAEQNWRALKKLDILSAGSLREKILLYLSYEAMYFDSLSFEIPFDRQEMADYLYADRSALSRELGRLRDEGLIDFTRNRFVLHLPGLPDGKGPKMPRGL